MLKLKIGQIIYFLLKSENKLLPLKVVEEVTKKSATSIETIYMVQFNQEADPVSLSSLNGEMYSSKEEAYNKLTQKSNILIRKLVDAAENRAKSVFGDFTEPVEETHQYAEQDEIRAELAQTDNVIELPDGTLAKVKIDPQVANLLSK